MQWDKPPVGGKGTGLFWWFCEQVGVIRLTMNQSQPITSVPVVVCVNMSRI